MATKPIAVVIGVGPGLGTSLARRFAKGGYAIALVSRQETHLKPVQQELEQQGHTAISVPADASDASSVKQAFQQIRQKLGEQIDVLLYNAGAFTYASILDLKPEQLQQNINISIVGGLVASQEVLPSMVKNSKGTILFTGATASLRGSTNFAGLAVPKFALRALAQSMSREFGPKGVHVAHIIIDGQIDTPGQVQSQPNMSINQFLNSDAIAENYWQLHAQHQTTWTQELDLRPSVEPF